MDISNILKSPKTNMKKSTASSYPTTSLDLTAHTHEELHRAIKTYKIKPIYMCNSEIHNFLVNAK